MCKFRLLFCSTIVVFFVFVLMSFSLNAYAQSLPCATESIPGGGFITFSSERDGDMDIYVIKDDECNLFQMTDDGVNHSPAWSPDESKLVYQSGVRLHTMNADGTGKAPLMDSALGKNDTQPAWSPDGSKIAFTINFDVPQGHEIYVVNADGTGLQGLTWTRWRDNYNPAWTPDSSKILFTSRQDPGNDGEIWAVNVDGTNQHPIMPDNNWGDANGSMSPDGTKVAFGSHRDGNEEIYVMDPGGTNQTRLTNSPGYDTWPRWSPDGSRIVFMSNRDGNWEIYVMYADGSGQTRVTDNPGVDYMPAWGGSRVAVEPPTADGQTVSTEEDTPLPITLTGSDGDNDPLTFSIHTAPSNGRLEGIAPNLAYTPDPNYFGPDNFTFQVNDGLFDSNIASINIAVTPVNDPPVANDDSAVTDEDVIVTIFVQDNDSAGPANENQTLVTTGVTDPPYGTANINPEGSVTYTPDPDYNGADSFDYTVCDSDAACVTAAVNITVTPVNDAPVCAAVTPSVAALWPPNHQFESVTIRGVTDVEGDATTISMTSIFQDEPVNGTGDGDNSPDGQGIGTGIAQVRAERAGNSNGRVYHIGFTANDGNGGTCSGEIMVGVPKNQGKKGAPIDDGALYDSTTP